MSQNNKNIFQRFDDYIFQLKNNHSINLKTTIIFFFITFLALTPYLPHKYSYKVGDIANTNIKAPKDIRVYDEEATKDKIKRIKNNILPVYDFNTETLDNLKERISLFFEKCRNTLPFDKNKRITLKSEMEELFNCKISNAEFTLLEKKKFSEDIEWIIIKLISHYMEKGITTNDAKLDAYKNKGIIIRLIPSNEEITKRDIYTFYTLKEVKQLIKKNYIAITGRITKPYILKKLIIKLASNIIKPNLLYNKKESAKRIAQAKKNIKPVYYLLKKNEIIVREGSRINAQTLTKIKAIQNEKSFSSIIKKSFSIFILLFLLSFIIYQLFLEDLKNNIINSRDVLLFCIIISFSAIIFRGLFIVSSGLAESFTNISPYFFFFMIPFAFPTLLIKITVNEKYAFASAILISFFFFVLGGHILFLYALLGSLYIILRIQCCFERFAFIRLGLELGFFNVINLIGISFFIDKSGFLSLYTGFNIFSGFINGFFNSLILLGIIPIVELLFRYTSDLRLLELSNLEHPLLQEFLQKAPGSYQHSILVGRLAEEAAKEINANSLLARVGSYYHDIGKITKPLYFIENQSGKSNKHDNLTPNMSALILISHVKEGAELAKQYKLGDEIIDIIQQHHGTSLIKFFYKKALELHESNSKEDIDEKKFRYPGPKPKTKIAGIIMLADVVEATSRTLTEPTPSRIKGLVKNLIESVLNDGQLDECRLTLVELNTIRNSFTNTLNSIFHHRIEYPKDDKPNSTKKD